MTEFNTIKNTNPARYIIAGFLVILFFFGGITAWAVFLPFQGAVITSGMVKVMGDRQVIQHLEGGMVEKIFVQEGDLVKEGDVLIQLESSQVISNVDLFKGRYLTKLAEEARLKGEIRLQDEIVWPKQLLALKEEGEIADIMSTELDIFRYRKSDREGKVSLYRSQIKQLGNRIEGAKEEYKTQEAVIANLNEELTAKRPLLKDKYLGKSDILELERSLAQYEGRKGKLTQDIAEYKQMIEGYKLNMVDVENNYREEAVSQLGEVQDAIYEIQEQIKPIQDAMDRLQIKAPIGGEVLDLKVNSEGSGVVRAGMPLMEIVPTDSKLIIEVQVQPQDITSVSEGQSTKVQLAAFQRASIPPILGKVSYISSDLINQESARGVISYYIAQVEIDYKDLEAKNAYLTPGMPVTCYITTEKRNVISYLLGPLLENVDHAMRE